MLYQKKSTLIYSLKNSCLLFCTHPWRKEKAASSSYLYLFARATTRYHRLDSLHNRNVLSHTLEAGNLQSRCWEGGLFLRTTREGSAPCPSPRLTCGLHTHIVQVSVSTCPFLIKTHQSYWIRAHHLDYLCKDPISQKRSHGEIPRVRTTKYGQ